MAREGKQSGPTKEMAGPTLRGLSESCASTQWPGELNREEELLPHTPAAWSSIGAGCVLVLVVGSLSFRRASRDSMAGRNLLLVS